MNERNNSISIANYRSFVVVNKHSELKVGPVAVCIGATVC